MPLVITDPQPSIKPQHFEAIGRLCAGWAYLEMLTDQLAWGILGVDHKIGSIITAKKDMRARWSLILEHAEEKHKNEMSLLRKINKNLGPVADDRNLIVHGLLEMSGGTQFISITRGVHAGKLFPISVEAVDVVLSNISSLRDDVVSFGNRNGYFHPPPPSEIVSGWPKPIS